VLKIPGIVISGPPRTKKTSNNVIFLPKKGSRACGACGHRPGFPKVMPSDAFREWELAALTQTVGIKTEFRRRGIVLPIAGMVSIEALIYRAQLSGDACGFYQAIGDMLQSAGILSNDNQIEDWDGSRRLKDAGRPRVEIYITVVQERAVQEDLPL
jgi:hypothetical protein